MVNPLPGNPHGEPANYADIEATPYTQAQAMLAIAYELRTANLIASLQTITISGNAQLAPDEETAITTLVEIARRLDRKAGGVAE
jgi:hypothetical protein